jgi:hypothetical protein
MKKLLKHILTFLSVACITVSAVSFVSCKNTDDDDTPTILPTPVVNTVVNTGFSGTFFCGDIVNNSRSFAKVYEFAADGKVDYEYTSKTLKDSDGKIAGSHVSSFAFYTKNGSTITWTENGGIITATGETITATIVDNDTLKIGDYDYKRTAGSIFAFTFINDSENNSLTCIDYLLKDDNTYVKTSRISKGTKEVTTESGTYNISDGNITLKASDGTEKSGTIGASLNLGEKITRTTSEGKERSLNITYIKLTK